MAAYVGHAGRLFYNSDNGVVKLSDGVTPGGTPIPYTIATGSVVGGIKAGSGVVIAGDGTLTIDAAGLPVSFGNLYVTDNILSSINSNADVVIQSNGTGNVELVGNVAFYATSQGHTGTPYFQAFRDGQITILVPASDPQAGAVKIIGSATGRVSPPLNTGVMLQLTGNNNDASRLYNDAIGGFAGFVGRRINGNLTTPTAVQAGDEIIRISSTGHDGVSVPGTAGARIVYQALENYTPSARGTNLSIWTTAVSSNVLTKTATFDSASGLTVTKATIQGNLTVQGSIIGNATSTTATIGTLTVSGNVQAAGANIGYITMWQNSIYSQLTSSDITIGQLAATANIVLNRSTVHAKDAYFNANVVLYDTNATGSGFNKTGGTVTAHGRNGQITSAADSLAKNAAGTFTVTNAYVRSNKDVIIVNIASGATVNSYAVAVSNVQVGSFNITTSNNGTGALAEALTYNFVVLNISS